MESLSSNRPQGVPSSRLSGFTLNTCCKSAALLFTAGRSDFERPLANRTRAGKGRVEPWRFCCMAQRARDGTEPGVPTWSERSCRSVNEIQLFKHSRRRRRRRVRAPEWVYLNETPGVCCVVDKHPEHGWGVPTRWAPSVCPGPRGEPASRNIHIVYRCTCYLRSLSASTDGNRASVKLPSDEDAWRVSFSCSLLCLGGEVAGGGSSFKSNQSYQTHRIHAARRGKTLR